jgi:ComF family protein
MVAAYPFEGPIRSAILAFKYGARTRLAPFLASTLAARLATRPLMVDCVIPVPLSRGRLQSRGFNQSELLARPLAEVNGWVLDFTSLVRARDTRQQTELPARERRANVVGAFAVVRPEAVQGKRVLLVDDVCTTGATLEACATPLLEAGAAGVWGLVVARDLMRSR